MTPESALLYLDLPSTLLMADAVLPLINAAKKYLADRYKDITKFKEEVMVFPVWGIEAILASDDLEVESEDVVYDFVLDWVRQHYNILEERLELMDTRLAPLNRFPFMSCSKLEEAFDYNDFTAFKLATEALLFKARPLHAQRLMMEKAAPLDLCRFVERAYEICPIKVVEFDLPRQHCVIFLDMKREVCAILLPPSAPVWSQSFHLGGNRFNLSAQSIMRGQEGTFLCFGLDLGTVSSSLSFAVDYECAIRYRPTEEFVNKVNGNCTFTSTRRVFALFTIPWTLLVDDSVFFLNNVLHVRVKLTIKQ